MIINRMRSVRTTDMARTAWSGLRRFHNVAFVTDLLGDLHKVPRKYKNNVRKQAEQIRFCLMQAHEYHDSSRVISAVTKPVLLYYSLMSLATAEVLFKQSGDSSIDKAREQHRHHGLTFSVASISEAGNVAEAASTLSARPATRRNDERYGTFELWRKSARGYPLIAKRNTIDGSKNLTSYYPMGRPPDNPTGSDWKTVSLTDCLKCLPALAEFCNESRIRQEMVRATISVSNYGQDGSGSLTIIIHPHSKEVYENVIGRISFKADLMERVSFTDNENHGHLTYKWTSVEEHKFLLPSSSHIYQDECRLHSDQVEFNEFGYYYLALYMCGNYARYYPDFWIKDVEKSSLLFAAIDNVMRTAEDRVPLLALSELEQTFLVLER